MAKKRSTWGNRPASPAQSPDSLPRPRRNRVPKRKPRPGVDEYGRTPLWNLAFAGDLVGVKKELDCAADPNVGDDDGYTPLHIAIQEAHFEVVELLLERGADPNQPDHHGNGPEWTAAFWAMRSDRTERKLAILGLLLTWGADILRKNRYGRSTYEILRRVNP